MIKKTLEYIESLINEKLNKYHWRLKLDLCHSSGEKSSYYYTINLIYAPKEWSNGTTEWTHISEHLVKGLNRVGQPMTSLVFKNFEGLIDWLNTVDLED